MFSSFSKMWHGSTESDGLPRTRTTPTKTRSTLVKSWCIKQQCIRSVASLLFFAMLVKGANEKVRMRGVCPRKPWDPQHNNVKFGQHCPSCKDEGLLTDVVTYESLKEAHYFVGRKWRTSSKTRDRPQNRSFVLENKDIGSGKKVPIIRYQDIGKSAGDMNFKPKGMMHSVDYINLRHRENKWEFIIKGTKGDFKRNIQGDTYILKDAQEKRELKFDVNFDDPRIRNPRSKEVLLMALILHFNIEDENVGSEAKAILKMTSNSKPIEAARRHFVVELPGSIVEPKFAAGMHYVIQGEMMRLCFQNVETCGWAKYVGVHNGQPLIRYQNPHDRYMYDRLPSDSSPTVNHDVAPVDHDADDKDAFAQLNETFHKVVAKAPPSPDRASALTRRRLLSPLNTLNEQIRVTVAQTSCKKP